MSFAILARVILSWVNQGRERGNKIEEILYDMTEPVINLARKLPHRAGMMDLSYFIALIGIDIFRVLFNKIVLNFFV